MANTYTQLYVQLVFAVKYRQNLISEKHREAIEKYICGIVNTKKSKPLAIYCNPDHIHILIGWHPSTSLSDLVRDIKANSSKWINKKTGSVAIFVGKMVLVPSVIQNLRFPVWLNTSTTNRYITKKHLLKKNISIC